MKWTVMVSLVLILLTSTSASASTTTRWSSKASVERVIAQVFGRVSSVARCIARSESPPITWHGKVFYNLYSTGRAGERGIFQIHPVHFTVNGGPFAAQHLYELRYNVLAAYSLYHAAGWYPWVAEKGVCW